MKRRRISLDRAVKAKPISLTHELVGAQRGHAARWVAVAQSADAPKLKPSSIGLRSLLGSGVSSDCAEKMRFAC
jgi:hypothetical protein